LIRHADARSKGAREVDFDRSLSARGEKDAAWTGKWLKERAAGVDLILSSSAIRARESARLIAGELGFSASQINTDKALYLAGVSDLLDVIHALEDSTNEVIIVSHNPGLIQFANWLTNSAVNNLPTSGILCIDLPFTSWREVIEGGGTLKFFDHPS
jgi:phosphohistidine phosphatase